MKRNLIRASDSVNHVVKLKVEMLGKAKQKRNGRKESNPASSSWVIQQTKNEQ